MTVAELIEELKKYPADMPVAAPSGNGITCFVRRTETCHTKGEGVIYDRTTPWKGEFVYIRSW